MRSRWLAPLVVIVALSASFSAPARADTASDIDAGEAAYAGLDYERANALAQKVIATHGLTHEQVVRAYRLLGRTYAVLGKTQQAIDAFEKLLTYAPDEKTDRSQSPRIQEAFEQAEGFWAGYPTRAGMDATVASLRAGAPGRLRVQLRDPTHQVKKVTVSYRWGGTGAFTTVDLAPAEEMQVDIPAGPPQVARLDYYVDALDGLDDQAFTVGDPAMPRTTLADMTPPPTAARAEHAGGGRSIFASPVFWVATGVVLAGGAAGAYFGLRKPTDVTSPPTSANLTGALFCGGTADGHCH